MGSWVAIGVPIDSSGRPGGTELAPAALRAHGLPAALGARDDGDLAPRVRGDARDPATGLIDPDGVVAVTAAVREAVRAVAAAGDRPLLLGGCCTLVPGALAGLRDAGGRVGVAYVDGHVDVYDGRTSPTGEAADMPLSVALGREPAGWAAAAGGAVVDAADVVVLGARDPEEAADVAPLLTGELAALEVLGPQALRAQGPAAAGRAAAARLAAGPGRFFVHLDVDVLDEAAMPATDYLLPGGLEWEELAALLAPLGAADGLAGLSIGCLNPEKDAGGACTARTAALVARALAG